MMNLVPPLFIANASKTKTHHFLYIIILTIQNKKSIKQTSINASWDPSENSEVDNSYNDNSNDNWDNSDDNWDNWDYSDDGSDESDTWEEIIIEIF